MMMTPITEYSDPNESSSGKSYEFGMLVDGKLTCQCRGWVSRNPVTGRTCKHVEGFIRKFHLITRVVVDGKNNFLYASNNPAAPAAASRTPKAAKPLPTPKASKPVTPAPEPAKTTRFAQIDEADEDTAVFVNPMLADSLPEEFEGSMRQRLAAFLKTIKLNDWVMEEKYDGERKVVTVNEGRVVAYSRPRGKAAPNVYTMPEHLVEAFAKFPTGTYDGEVMTPGGRSYNVRELKNAGKQIFIVFDVLSLLGMSTLQESYDARRGYLKEIFGKHQHPAVTLAPSVTPTMDFVEEIWSRDGEGAILKRRASKYQPGQRSRDFLKVKALETAVLVVTGYEEGKLGPHATVRLKDDEGNETTVKTLDNAALRAFAANPLSFIGRRLRIEYQERTPDGGYRHPRWDRWENQ